MFGATAADCSGTSTANPQFKQIVCLPGQYSYLDAADPAGNIGRMCIACPAGTYKASTGTTSPATATATLLTMGYKMLVYGTAPDTFKTVTTGTTATNHNLVQGDKVKFSTTFGGVTAGTEYTVSAGASGSTFKLDGVTSVTTFASGDGNLYVYPSSVTSVIASGTKLAAAATCDPCDAGYSSTLGGSAKVGAIASDCSGYSDNNLIDNTGFAQKYAASGQFTVQRTYKDSSDKASMTRNEIEVCKDGMYSTAATASTALAGATVTSINTGTGIITTAAAHGFVNGDAIKFTATTTFPTVNSPSGGTSVSGTTFYVVYDGTTTFKVSDTQPHAIASPASGVFTFDGQGSGTITVYRQGSIEPGSVKVFTGATGCITCDAGYSSKTSSPTNGAKASDCTGATGGSNPASLICTSGMYSYTNAVSASGSGTSSYFPAYTQRLCGICDSGSYATAGAGPATYPAARGYYATSASNVKYANLVTIAASTTPDATVSWPRHGLSADDIVWFTSEAVIPVTRNEFYKVKDATTSTDSFTLKTLGGGTQAADTNAATKEIFFTKAATVAFTATASVATDPGISVGWTGHNLVNGDVVYFGTTGTLPANVIVAKTGYYVISAATNSFRIASDASGTAIPYSIGTHFAYLAASLSTSTDTSSKYVTATATTSATVDMPVIFHNVGASSLVAGTMYFVKTADADSNNVGKAVTVAAVPSTEAGQAAFAVGTQSGDSVRMYKGVKKAFASGTGISQTGTVLVVDWGSAHGFPPGTPIRFYSSDSTMPTGIQEGTLYYVIATDLTANTFKVSISVTGAAAGGTTVGPATTLTSTITAYAVPRAAITYSTLGSTGAKLIVNWGASLAGNTIMYLETATPDSAGLPSGLTAADATTQSYTDGTTLAASSFAVKTGSSPAFVLVSLSAGTDHFAVAETVVTATDGLFARPGSAAHGLKAGDIVYLAPLPGATIVTGYAQSTKYYVSTKGLTSTAFKLATVSASGSVLEDATYDGSALARFQFALSTSTSCTACSQGTPLHIVY